MKGINICTVVWGQKFLENFLNLVLPSILVENNLPFLKNKIKCKYKLYTNIEGKNYLQEKFKKLSLNKIIEIQINTNIIEKNLNEDKYKLANFCYSDCLEICRSNEYGFIWIMPDQVQANNNFRNIYKYIKDKKIIFVPSFLSTDLEKMKKDLFNYKKKFQLDIGVFELSRLTYKHLIDDRKRKFIDNYILVKNTELVFWNVKDVGIVMNTLHLNPIFINPIMVNEKYEYKNISIESSDYLSKVTNDLNDIHFIKNNTEYFSVGLENHKKSSILKNKDNFLIIYLKYIFLLFYIPLYLKETIRSPEFIKKFNKTSEIILYPNINNKNLEKARKKGGRLHRNIIYIYDLYNFKFFFYFMKFLFFIFFHLKSKFFTKGTTKKI